MQERNRDFRLYHFVIRCVTILVNIILGAVVVLAVLTFLMGVAKGGLPAFIGGLAAFAVAFVAFLAFTVVWYVFVGLYYETERTRRLTEELLITQRRALASSEGQEHYLRRLFELQERMSARGVSIHYDGGLAVAEKDGNSALRPGAPSV